MDVDAEGVAALVRDGYRAVCADVQDLDLGRQFDTIIAGEIIEHLENPWAVFYKAVRKHLKRGGQLIITTPNPFYAAPGLEDLAPRAPAM